MSKQEESSWGEKGKENTVWVDETGAPGSLNGDGPFKEAPCKPRKDSTQTHIKAPMSMTLCLHLK